MDSRTLGQLVDLLETERQRLEAELQKELPEAENATCTHQADVATDAQERMKAMGLRELHKCILEQVLTAQARVKKRTYGTCEQCGGEIDVERLKVRSYTPFCISCARATA